MLKFDTEYKTQNKVKTKKKILTVHSADLSCINLLYRFSSKFGLKKNYKNCSL